jgi:RNA recognition motif-containing protein
MLEKNKLFVGNLDGRVKRWHLKEFFSQYGEVTYTKVAVNKDTGKSRGFGFVVFGNDADASTALEQANGKVLTASDKDNNQIIFGDRQIRCMYAQAQETTTPSNEY